MSERYYNSRQSNMDKAGEPQDHVDAVQKVIKALKSDNWIHEEKSVLRVVLHWTKDGGSSNFRMFNNNYVHEFDVTFVKTHNNGLRSFLIVEIDGIGTRHEKIFQMNRDKTAAEYAKFATFQTYRDILTLIKDHDLLLYDRIMEVISMKHAHFANPDVYFIRLNKEDISFWSEIEILDKIKTKIKEHFI